MTDINLNLYRNIHKNVMIWDYGCSGTDVANQEYWEKEKLRTLYMCLLRASNQSLLNKNKISNVLLTDLSVATTLSHLDMYETVITENDPDENGIILHGKLDRFNVYADLTVEQNINSRKEILVGHADKFTSTFDIDWGGYLTVIQVRSLENSPYYL